MGGVKQKPVNGVEKAGRGIRFFEKKFS